MERNKNRVENVKQIASKGKNTTFLAEILKEETTWVAIHTRRWEDNIKMNITETGCEDGLNLRRLVSSKVSMTVIKLGFHSNSQTLP